MNRTVKFAAIGAAVCILSASLFSCGGGVDKGECYELIKASSEAAAALEAGEILIYESVTADVDIEDCYTGGTTETYIRFTGGEALDFELSSSKAVSIDSPATTYELIKSGDTVFELYDGVGKMLENPELPDIFENFRVNFTAEDIKKVEVETGLKGVKAYKLTMTKAYINSFDSKTESAQTDCNGITYTYYLDPHGELEKVVCETLVSVKAGDKTQTVIKVTDSAIA